MTLAFFPLTQKEFANNERYYTSQFDGNTYQVIDSIESREVCVCSNYDEWEDAEKRAINIAKLLNASNEKTLG